MPAITAPVLVLGLGNDILTDDAVGLHIARELQDRLGDDPDIEVKSTTEMGLVLLDEIVDRQRVVLVDSIQTGKVPPGHIHEMMPDELHAPVVATPHFLGIAETLHLGRQLNLTMPACVTVFAVEVLDPFTLGMELTPVVADAVPRAVDRVLEHLRAVLPSML